MRLFNVSVVVIAAMILTAACIREEALNAEADIIECQLDPALLNRNPVIENDRVVLMLRKGTDLTSLAPVFTLTPGATIEPASGTPLDFTSPRYYTVISQDKEWKKVYKVEATTSALSTFKYSLEHVRMSSDGKYHLFYEVDENGSHLFDWATANAGYSLTGAGAEYTDFPTRQDLDGYIGKCARLETLRTGALAEKLNKPLAAGNLFLGQFVTLNALTDPLSATKFGVPFDHVPGRFRGYFRYTAGDVFYRLDKSAPGRLSPVEGRTDKFALYAVFYEATDEKPSLDGNNTLDINNPQILATAEVTDTHPTDRWKEFDIPFVFRPGKTVDPVKLSNGDYNLAIVCASSADGASFEGAPGSVLMVDELVIEFNED